MGVAPIPVVLFAIFLVTTLTAIGYAAYAAGALIGGRASGKPFVAPPVHHPIRPTGAASATPSRFARGTESPPIFDHEPATMVEPIAVVPRSTRDLIPRSN